MNLYIIPLALLIAGCIIILVWTIARVKSPIIPQKAKAVVIIVNEQGPWVEGVMRKVFFLTRDAPWVKVQVLDCGSRDNTREILWRLQRHYPFELVCVEGEQVNEAYRTIPDVKSGTKFDLRGLSGKELFHAPLFYQLPIAGAGKSKALSK